MFKAIVLMCIFTGGPQQGVCVEAHDDWGPYNTKEQCKARIEKMIADLKTIPSGFIPIGSKCVNQGEGEGV